MNNLVKGDSQPVLALCTMNDKGTVISVNGITKYLEQFLDKDFKAIKEKAKRDVHLVIAVIVKDEVLPWKNFRKIQEVANSKEVSEYTIVRFRFAEPKGEAK